MKKRRGQVTIFIILGMVLLLLIFLFIVFQKSITVFKPERVVPPELKPLDDFIGGCVQEVARDGILLLGANGGFIRFPEDIALDPFSSLQSNPLFPGIKNPLWYYKGSAKIPSEEYMKEDLAYYINENLDSCLGDLAVFSEQLTINELEERKIEVELTDKGVDVLLDYPLEIISKEGQKTVIQDFLVMVPLRLKTTYELARDLIEEELGDQFLELRTIDLLALDPDIPYTNVEFSCSPRFWYVPDIEKKLRRILSVNVPLIRVDKTSYDPISEDQPYAANHYVWQVTELEYPTTHVSFTYDETWPLQLAVRPNDGVWLRSDAHRGFDVMSFFCMHIWHYTYDINYPVLAIITDDAAKDHDAYTFSFAFEVSVNHNRPDKRNFGITTFDYLPKARSDEFCEISPTNLLTIHTFENISTEEFGELYEEIANVNLSYTCIRLRCPIGETEFTFGGAVSLLSEEVPYCVNGVLRGTKPGYEEAEIFVSTDAEKTVELYLTPLVSKNISVVKHPAFGNRLDEEEALDPSLTAIITIKRDAFTERAIYPSKEVLSDVTLLGKWDYTYEVEVYLADDRTILGGYKGNWTVPWNDLKKAKEIKFHVAEFPYTEQLEQQFAYISTIAEVSKKLPAPELLS